MNKKEMNSAYIFGMNSSTESKQRKHWNHVVASEVAGGAGFGVILTGLFSPSFKLILLGYGITVGSNINRRVRLNKISKIQRAIS